MLTFKCIQYLSLDTYTDMLAGCVQTYIICLLGLLHDKLPHHGRTELHQIGQNICGCSPHLEVIHGLCRKHSRWLPMVIALLQEYLILN